MQNWYVAQLKPNAIRLAETNLRRQGFTVFMPRIERTERFGSGFKLVCKPLFPGYLFVAERAGAQHWPSIYGTRGVTRLVSFGGRAPCSVPANLIQALETHLDDRGVLQPENQWKAGDTVKIAKGPLSDFIARVQSVDDEGRIWALLDFLGKETRVQLEPDQVGPAG